ncbi:MAG: zf-HC2 domain-containing protein, partial [Candidatus Omnitrophica bacterium]|nr:zf-HC2 domain-containing protein [Candidatus Omnitrophota bacterium]
MRKPKDKIDNLLIEYYKTKEGFLAKDKMMLREGSVRYYKISEPTRGFQKKKEPCPKIGLLAGYLEGALKGNEKNKIEEHIRKCSDCRHKVLIGKDLIQRYKEGKLKEIPEDITAKNFLINPSGISPTHPSP